MLRAERPQLPLDYPSRAPDASAAREVLLAVAPPPRAPSFFLSGWPNWLVPQFKSGGHRPETELSVTLDEGHE